LSSEQAQDITKTIAYGSGRTAAKYIAMSALVLVVGLVVAFGKKDWLLGGPLAAVAAVAIVWQINGLRSAEPLLRLTPAGLRLNLDGRVFLDIPWQEVEAISSLNLTFEVLQKRWYDLQGDSPGYFLAKMANGSSHYPIKCCPLTAISFAPKSRPVGRPSANGRTRARDRRSP
jgi:hypothetical protein